VIGNEVMQKEPLGEFWANIQQVIVPITEADVR
jgi:hypothetical protein